MRRQNSRRNFLKAAGVSIALPMLESRRIAQAASTRSEAPARRFVAIGTYLGFHQPAFYPEKTGRDYEISELLKPAEALRDEFTVFSGLDHRAANGHKNWSTFLTGQRLGGVSLDQLVAEHVGATTRFRSLEISAGKISRPMNFTRGGVGLPNIERPSVLYRKLFASPDDQARMDYLLASGQSALDKVRDEARQLARTVTPRDRRKLDEYFTAVRDVERRLQRHQAGSADPVPTVDYQLPEFDPLAPTLMLECQQVMYDLIALALQTDSTRVMSMNIGGLGQVFTLDGRTLRAGYHALSHHGNDPDKIRDLVRVEVEHIRKLTGFLEQLKQKTDEHNRPLLDTTIVLLGTGMGDSSRHSNVDLPTFVAGGGLKHGQHISVDRKDAAAPVLGDLYLTLMQQLGMEIDTFSNASRNMNQYLT